MKRNLEEKRNRFKLPFSLNPAYPDLDFLCAIFVECSGGSVE